MWITFRISSCQAQFPGTPWQQHWRCTAIAFAKNPKPCLGVVLGRRYSLVGYQHPENVNWHCIFIFLIREKRGRCNILSAPLRCLDDGDEEKPISSQHHHFPGVLRTKQGRCGYQYYSKSFAWPGWGLSPWLKMEKLGDSTKFWINWVLMKNCKWVFRKF